VPAPGEAVAVLIVGLAALLTVRLLIAVPGWVRHARKPETRAIRVVGVGGGGSNAVDRMVRAHIKAASFVVCNTDAQALRRSSAETKIRIGEAITGGLGSGGDPEIGRRAAQEDEAKIAHAVAGADLVFVTAGLGGGTGSGAAPIVAANARSQGALTIAVVTKPFGFEGSHRERVAEAAAAELAAHVDALIVVPNDRVADVLDADASMIDAFGVVDDVLLQAVQGIIDLITAPGLINLDFADVRSVMQDAGPALIGLGRGTGEHRATDAARQAIASPLLEASIEGARGILFNVSGPTDLRLREVRGAAEAIREHADPEANVIFGASFTESLGQDVLITLIATGLSTQAQTAPRPAEAQPADSVSPVVEPPPDAPAPRPPKRPARAVTELPVEQAAPVDDSGPVEEIAPADEDLPAAEPTPASTQHIQARSAGGPEPAWQPPRRSTSADGDDLDVPSFLRRRPSSRT
jgi:cell division protein FtsZ